MGLRFTKMQGAGNDFIVVTGDGPQDWARLATVVCDRHYGVGGDGVLVLLPSEVADFKMRIFNPDGSEAEACGNGLRCFAKYILLQGMLGAETEKILIETITGIRTVMFDRIRQKIAAIRVNLGKPQFSAHDIPVLLDQKRAVVNTKLILDYPLTINGMKLSLSFVSMGNPHAVHFWKHPVAYLPLTDLGPKVEHHRIFPKRTNFEVANVLSRELIEARIWERGVGETLACGSGAAAIVVAARLQGLVDSRVDVKLPGGVLNVEWDGTGEVILSGPAEVVFAGEWQGEV